MFTRAWARCKCLLPSSQLLNGLSKSTSTRFVFSPTEDVKRRLAAEADELKSDMSNLEKKLHYLETTYKNSRDNLEQLFRSGAG